ENHIHNGLVTDFGSHLGCISQSNRRFLNPVCFPCYYLYCLEREEWTTAWGSTEFINSTDRLGR
ncbi:unnamed protein product, partial [Arabidopsis halleri]